MKKSLIMLVAIISLAGCARNAITGRKQLNLVPEGELKALALTQYKDFLSKNKVVPAGNANADMVKRVGNRVADAIKKYYTEKGLGDAINGYEWEFNLVDSKEVNAWCMPGGKVVVYTELLSVTKDETALAIVMGHEITHAVVGHGNERMSQQMAAQGLGALGSAALGTNEKAVNTFNQVYGLGAQYGVLLPYSRKQELEADKYGLIFAAIAGYDPNKAIDFWTRMASLGGQKPPVFMSDHPSDEERIQKIREALPEVLQYYKAR
jgi:predicted Zn-dependent protease